MRTPHSDYVPLNVHSAYSLGAGASSLEEIAARAAALGYPAVALTDTGAGYGLPAFQVCCDAAEIRALLGAEIEDLPGGPTESPGHPSRAVLLIENETGYRHLCQLLTQRQLDPAFTLVDDLPPLIDGLIVLTSAPALLRELADVLPPERLYAELIADDPTTYHRTLLDLAKALERPIVGTHRIFFDTPSRHTLHRLQLAMHHLRFLREVVPGAMGRDGRPIDLRPASAALRKPAEAARDFAGLPEAIKNTRRIAERLTFRLERSVTAFDRASARRGAPGSRRKFQPPRHPLPRRRTTAVRPNPPGHPRPPRAGAAGHPDAWVLRLLPHRARPHDLCAGA